MMSNGVIFSILWTMVNVCTDIVETAHTEVECFPNSTITLTNPIPNALFYGSAVDTDGACNVTFSDDFGLIIVDGCSKNKNIIVQLTDVKRNNAIIGGADKVLVSIMCQEISQGTEKNFTHGLTVGLVADETVGLNKTFAQFTYIRNGSVTSSPIGSARMLQELFFTYDLHEAYVARFLQCTAYAGHDSTSLSNRHKLIENDCTVDTDLINSFAPNKMEAVGNFTRYYTELTMFRFWTSFYVTIVCDVKICLAEHSAPCTMAKLDMVIDSICSSETFFPGASLQTIGTCPNTRKRRSSEVNAEEDPDVKYMSSRTTFKVLENPDYIFTPYMSSAGLLIPDLLVLVLMTSALIDFVLLYHIGVD